jgi:hypothetical protein
MHPNLCRGAWTALILVSAARLCPSNQQKKRDREKNFKKKEKRVHTCVDIADGDSVSSNDENGRRSLGEVMRKGSIKRTKVRDDEGTLGGRFAAYFGGTNDSFFFCKRKQKRFTYGLCDRMITKNDGARANLFGYNSMTTI